MARIVLASGSPRRQELLGRIGIRDFTVRVPQVEEWYPQGLTPPEVVSYISREKSQAVPAEDDEIVITEEDEKKILEMSTDVYFRPASEWELRAYIRGGEPMDKAGAYGVQGQGALLVERIDGDFFNVMGLPVLLLSRMLAEFGVTLL